MKYPNCFCVGSYIFLIGLLLYIDIKLLKEIDSVHPQKSPDNIHVMLKSLISSKSSDLENEVKWKEEIRNSFQTCATTNFSNVNLSTVCENSENFPIPFPVEEMRCKKLLSQYSADKLEENIKSSYPIIHEKVISLIRNFLKHKLVHGSDVEKSIYEGMKVEEFVTRLLTKRAVQFVGPSDRYQLLSGKVGRGNWEKVGTSREEYPLFLSDCLSYDEIKISSLLSVSSPSFFINNGNRHNLGIPDKKGKHQPWGIVIGAVGSRFEKPNCMEWQDMSLTSEQNTVENNYGKTGNSKQADFLQIWANFYQVPHFGDQHSLPNSPRPLGGYFAYKKRCKILAETILLEANQRGEKEKQDAFLHMVGLGLGVWQKSHLQVEYYFEAFFEALQELTLPKVSDIYFSWISVNDDNLLKKIKQKTTIGNTKIHFGRRNPHDQLQGEDKKKVLVVTYAWDGNALPGNEFWGGNDESNLLFASGDPAQACSSQIAELQNPHINPFISGDNLYIASPTLGKIIPLRQFLKIATDQNQEKEMCPNN